MDIVTAIVAGAKASGVMPALLLALCGTETNFHNVVHSNDGGSASLGVCQVKLTTARMFSPAVTERDLMNPYINATIAGRYLAYQIKRYRGDPMRAIVAYNRGTCPPVDSIDNNKYLRKVGSRLRELTSVKKREVAQWNQ